MKSGPQHSWQVWGVSLLQWITLATKQIKRESTSLLKMFLSSPTAHLRLNQSNFVWKIGKWIIIERTEGRGQPKLATWESKKAELLSHSWKNIPSFNFTLFFCLFNIQLKFSLSLFDKRAYLLTTWPPWRTQRRKPETLHKALFKFRTSQQAIHLQVWRVCILTRKGNISIILKCPTSC